MAFRLLYGLDLVSYWAIVGMHLALHYSNLRTSLAEARLAGLRAQLNPHFLFNTLNAISTLALKGDHAAVTETLGRLSGLLRAALDEHTEEISLGREIDILDDYVEIQRVRFGDRLCVDKRIADDALDYLLKPFTSARFHEAIDRARLEVARAGDHETHQRLIELLEERRRARQRDDEPYLTRLAVKHNQRMLLVKIADVDWIESSGNYAHLHTADANYVVRMTMAELERRLDPARFARIHRSTIVQVDRIADIIAAWHGDFDVTLRDGTVLRLTRNYRDRVLDRKTRR